NTLPCLKKPKSMTIESSGRSRNCSFSIHSAQEVVFFCLMVLE
nr:hypothetical protein [Tanacetum cinerariifolium]